MPPPTACHRRVARITRGSSWSRPLMRCPPDRGPVMGARRWPLDRGTGVHHDVAVVDGDREPIHPSGGRAGLVLADQVVDAAVTRAVELVRSLIPRHLASQVRALLIEGSQATLVRRDIEPTVQEVLDRAVLREVAHRPRVDHPAEPLGDAGPKEVVARPGGLGHQHDAQHLPGVVEEAAPLDVLGLGVLQGSAGSGRCSSLIS